jgi:nucleoside-diphosphate-sugar epimerase
MQNVSQHYTNQRYQTEEYEKDFIQPAIKGTVGILKSAQKNATVKRIVFTSSEVAIIPWSDFFAVETGKIFTGTKISTCVSANSWC